MNTRARTLAANLLCLGSPSVALSEEEKRMATLTSVVILNDIAEQLAKAFDRGVPGIGILDFAGDFRFRTIDDLRTQLAKATARSDQIEIDLLRDCLHAVDKTNAEEACPLAICGDDSKIRILFVPRENSPDTIREFLDDWGT